MIAYLRGNLCVWIGDPPPAYLAFDEVMPNAVNAAVGKVWTGSAFANPTANSEQANLATLMAQADAVIATNVQANTDANTWLTNNPGSNLATSVLTPAFKSVMQSLIRTNNQMDAVIRLLRAKLDGTN